MILKVTVISINIGGDPEGHLVVNIIIVSVPKGSRQQGYRA